MTVRLFVFLNVLYSLHLSLVSRQLSDDFYLPMKQIYQGLLALFCAVMLAACSQTEKDSELRVIVDKIMGTTYRIKYFVPRDVTLDPDMVKHNVHAVLQDIDSRMSTYKPDSELMSFNRAPVGEPIKLSADIIKLIEESFKVSAASGGVYDITVGSLVNLWGFGSIKPEDATTDLAEKMSEMADNPAFAEWVQRQQARVPSENEIKETLQRVGDQYLEIDSDRQTVTRKAPVFVDLSSIAKGYAVDQAGAKLESLGVTSYMVEVGGEVRIKGEKPGGSLWSIAVKEPDLMPGSVNTVVQADGKGIATSGDYLNYFEVGGQHFSHLINARTGWPEQHNLASVVVIDDTTAMADAWATMFMLVGEEQGLKIAEQQALAVWFIYHTADGFETMNTRQFEQYLRK